MTKSRDSPFEAGGLLIRDEALRRLDSDEDDRVVPISAVKESAHRDLNSLQRPGLHRRSMSIRSRRLPALRGPPERSLLLTRRSV